MSAADPRRHQAERLLAAHALGEGDAGAIVALLGRCEERRLPTGYVLFREGDPAGECYLLLEGRARVLRRDQAGREREIGSWFAPAIVGAQAPVDGGPRSATCVIAAPSVLGVLPAETLRRLLREPGAEGAHLRWLLLAAFTETLSSTTEYLRRVLGGAEAAQPDLDQIQAILEGARR